MIHKLIQKFDPCVNTLNPAVPTSDTIHHPYATTAHGRQKMPSKVTTMQDALYLYKHVYTVSVQFCLPHQNSTPMNNYRTPDIAVHPEHQAIN